MSERVREYLQRRIKGLTGGSEEVLEVAPEQVNSFDTWSALKLILLSSTTYMYTTVISDVDYYDDFYYIDALAGSGASEYGDDRCFLGSPLVAAKAAKAPFTKMYFVEQEKEYAEALRARLDYVFSDPNNEFTEPHDWEVIEGDANKEIPNIVSEINKRSSVEKGFNYLSFIDNQGMDVHWGSIRELTDSLHGDLLINLPIAQAIGRNVPSDKANEFYGEILLEEDLPRDDLRRFLRERYQENLRQQNRPIQVCTRVNTDIGSFCYDLLYATRQTDGEGGYEETIKYVREFIESVHSGNVNVILDILEGDQSTISSFMPEETEEVENELPDSEQTGLNEFC
jgi:three-Cys-motif partner protein